jgi:hypothetical protein
VARVNVDDLNVIREMSPRTKARLAGAFYRVTILTGVFAQGFISARLVVSGDAAATASNILSHDGLFRLGFAIYMIEMVCQIIDGTHVRFAQASQPEPLVACGGPGSHRLRHQRHSAAFST